MDNKRIKNFSKTKYSIDNPVMWHAEEQKRAKSEVYFLERLFKKYGSGKSVLDVGCGTGSHVNAFLKKNYAAFGVDINPEMIAFAKKKFGNQHFAVGDMKQIQLKNRFDAIICFRSVFVNNITHQEIMQTLNCFFQSLNKKGLVIIELFNPIVLIQKKKFNAKDVEVANGIKEIREEAVDERNQLLIGRRSYYKNNKLLEKWTITSRMFFPQELKFYLESAGFVFLGFYGGSWEGFSMKHTQLDDFRMLVVARKP